MKIGSGKSQKTYHGNIGIMDRIIVTSTATKIARSTASMHLREPGDDHLRRFIEAPVEEYQKQ